MAGKRVQNNFQSPQGTAWGAELRARLTPYIDAIGTYLDEGRRRPGLQAQRPQKGMSSSNSSLREPPPPADSSA
jgi:hypothetical protein